MANTLIKRRLSAQKLAGSRVRDPGELVAWMGAIQAQEYLSARWALALRLQGSPTEAEVEAALADGRVIRTHAFRGTWQLIAPEDVRWMVAISQASVKRKAASRLRELGLDADTLKRGYVAITKAMERSGALTRDELKRALLGAKISPEGQRLSHLLLQTELEGLICGGPRRGKQLTWRLLDTKADRRSTDDALAELALRFFQSRGPATVDDLSWWTGLTLGEVRRGVAAAGSALTPERVDGRELLRRTGGRVSSSAPRALLLPAFDEWMVGYRNRDDAVDPRHQGAVNQGGGIIGMSVAVDGRIVGSWRRTLERGGVKVKTKLFERVAEEDLPHIDEAIERYAAFLDVPWLR